MTKIDWCKKLNWTEEQIEDLTYTGYAYIRQGKYDIAIVFFEALVAIDPKTPYHWQTLGALYLQTNQYGKAIKTFDSALKLEANHNPTLMNLCKALLMIGKKEEGLKLASILKKEQDPEISNVATALLLAHGTI